MKTDLIAGDPSMTIVADDKEQRKRWAEEFSELLDSINPAEPAQLQIVVFMSKDLQMSADWLVGTITGESTATPLQQIMIRSWLKGYLASREYIWQ